jgi:predicted amidophosphoribosyltransferase
MRTALQFINQMIIDWVGVHGPPPKIAMAGFVPAAGCPWCGGALLIQPCPCVARKRPWNRLVRLGPYVPPLSSCLAEGKYTAWPEVLDLIGAELGRAVLPFVQSRAIVVPVPMPLIRRLSRRIDHAAVLANAVARVLRRPMRSPIWRCWSPPQASRTAAQRRTLRRKDFRLWQPYAIRARPIVLVDDVLTSGKTLELVSRLLRKGGSGPIIAAVAAVADPASNQIIGGGGLPAG